MTIATAMNMEISLMQASKKLLNKRNWIVDIRQDVMNKNIKAKEVIKGNFEKL